MNTEKDIKEPRNDINEHGASMEKIVALCKRRGFVYQSSEIYGGLAGVWDYGPLGTLLKRHIEQMWFNTMTRKYANIVGLDSSIMMHPRIWDASGHTENFNDMLVDCLICKSRFRMDHLTRKDNKCEKCEGNLSEPRRFNLMFKTQQGPVQDKGLELYLRPETAQGIFVNFKNVMDTNRVSIPFGIAQVGKAFRNEITTKNFIFRTYEFEQMEMQFFVKPETHAEWLMHWKEERLRYYTESLGILGSRLRLHQHTKDELAHYAADAYDIEYHCPFGWQEVEGIHDRGDFDLKRHTEFSGKELHCLNQDTQQWYVPHVIETSAGLTRSVLISILDAYEEQKLPSKGNSKEDIRTVLHFHPNIAPITAAIFPLVKKDNLDTIAMDIYHDLCLDFDIMYDQNGAIGRRYRRMDEIGTPYCITVDYDTKISGYVTLRLRDSMEQIRVHHNELRNEIVKQNRLYHRS